MFFVYLEHESWTRKTMESSWTGTIVGNMFVVRMIRIRMERYSIEDI
jgi:hypothetical protein